MLKIGLLILGLIVLGNIFLGLDYPWADGINKGDLMKFMRRRDGK